MTYSIIPASVRHIRPMSATMRTAGSMAVQAFGFEPRAALRRAFVASFYCRTALVEGRPVAMWGLAGTLLSDSAYAWLVLSREVTRMPIAVVREARAELQRAARAHGDIATTVLPDDKASIRFALHLGFKPSDGETLDEPEGDFMTDPRYRIPMGESYAVRLGLAPMEGV